MTFIEFKNNFKDFPVISLSDINKSYPNFDNRRLVEWQTKGYIKKIRNGFYIFSGKEKNESYLYLIASRIYKPAYVSFESALSYYGLIPEGVFTVTSATTNNTAMFKSPLCNFHFRHLKPSLYFGYVLLKQGNFIVNMAEPEKTILDYLYLHKLDTTDSIIALRINKIVAKELIDFNKIARYLVLFNSQVLKRRAKILQSIIDD